MGIPLETTEGEQDIKHNDEHDSPNDQPHPTTTKVPKPDMGTIQNFIEIYKELLPLWKPMLACCTVFAVTGALYPGIVSRVTTTNTVLNQDGWFIIILMTLFCLFSLIGNLLLREKYFVKIPAYVIYILVCARFVFFPLWTLCVNPHVFEAEVFPVAIMIFFGLSNGFCGTYMMMYGPSLVSSKKENATVAMGFSLAIGMAIGLSLGYIINTVYP